jgi:hypothetical protein
MTVFGSPLDLRVVVVRMPVPTASPPNGIPSCLPQLSQCGPTRQRQHQTPTDYSVYFYTFATPILDSVFAVIGEPETIIAQPYAMEGVEIIQYFLGDLRFNELLPRGPRAWQRASRSSPSAVRHRS